MFQEGTGNCRDAVSIDVCPRNHRRQRDVCSELLLLAGKNTDTAVLLAGCDPKVFFGDKRTTTLFRLAEGVFSLYHGEFQRMPFHYKHSQAAFFCRLASDSPCAFPGDCKGDS